MDRKQKLKFLKGLLIEIELYDTSGIRLSSSEEDYEALKWAIEELEKKE